MKFMIVVALLAVCASAAKLDVPVAILKSASEQKEDGSFSYSFESEDGVKVEASGVQKQIGSKPEEAGIAAKGSYSYTSPEGTVITLSYVADENGFQPTGAHLPVAPPMPDHVVKLLADLKAAGVL